MSALTLDEMWKDFIKRANIADAPADQLSEMKFAFICGSGRILHEMLHVIDSPDVSEEEGMKNLQSWDIEFRAFIKARIVEYELRRARN